MNLVLLFILGLIMGSFYTVVGLRRPNNESIIKPRSHCPKCNYLLKWYDLIPIVSFVIRGGKCAYCKEKISLIYPVIELFTGILFMLSYVLYGFNYEFLAMLVISSLLILIFVSDFKYMIILDGPLILCSLAILALKWIYFGGKTALLSIISGIVLLIVMSFIKFLGDAIFKKESLGGGDIKLSFFIGCVLGIRLGFISLVGASIIALPYAIVVVLSNKEKEIPFGPFLISSLLLTFVFMEQITNFLSILYTIY